MWNPYRKCDHNRMPCNQSDKNRQQYRRRPHIFRPAGKFVILRAYTINYRLNRTVEDFNDHHQHHGTNQQHASNRIDVQPAGDSYAQQYGNAFWRNAASLIHAARKPFGNSLQL